MAHSDTHGIRPPAFRLPAATRVGAVHLQVSDLDRSLGFYGEVLGFRVLDRTENTARLGAEEDLLVLVESPGVRPVAPRSRLGLFHFAVLLPSRADFGRLLRHLVSAGVQPGASDHGVSEAIYLTDPDGLGLEVYRDRPRSEWRTRGRELAMTTEPLDAAGAMAAAGDQPWDGLPAGTRIGHVHLHVGSLDGAEAFYHARLGLDKTVWSYPGALFLSAGGYHHHLGVNTWAAGALPTGPRDARLLEWRLIVSDDAAVDRAAEGMEAAGHPVDRDGPGILIRDPWGTAVRVVGG